VPSLARDHHGQIGDVQAQIRVPTVQIKHSFVVGGSGGGIRTRDLRVMSPTSYQTAPPRGGLMMVALASML
jgi:hypothetical protein